MRFVLIPLLVLAVASTPACQTSKSSAPTTPPTGMSSRPSEYASLDRLLGKWKGTATMTKATGTYAEHMPKTQGGALPTFASGMTASWTLGGHFLKNEGWYELAPGQKVNFVEYMTYNPKEKKYQAFFFSEAGEIGEGTYVLNNNLFTSTWKGMKNGMPTKGKGTMNFTTPDTIEWTMIEEGDGGMMEMRGTSTR